MEVSTELNISIDIVDKVFDKLEREKILTDKHILHITFSGDDIPDYCECCNRDFGDVLIDEIYEKEIKQQEDYQKRYKEKLDDDFEEKLFNTFDRKGRHQLNLYIQKESSEYVIATLKSLKSKIKVENIIRLKNRDKNGKNRKKDV